MDDDEIKSIDNDEIETVDNDEIEACLLYTSDAADE